MTSEEARNAHNVMALPSLLVLLEAHLDLHGRIVPRAQWESAYDPPPPGWVPPEPEPDCDGRCPACRDFADRRCRLREERWAAEWEKLRRRYPVLRDLERLLAELMREHPHWASALYWVHVQSWDRFEPARREDWEKAGIGWLCERIDGWLPVYVPEGMPEPDPPNERRRLIVALRVQDKLSYSSIAKRARCSKSYVSEVLRAAKVR